MCLKIGATSIAEVEKMIRELQAEKDFLESEGERVQREAEHYTTLTQMASASVKIISDTVAGWREAGHPLRNHSRSSQFDFTLSPAEDTSSARVPDQHQSQRPIRASAAPARALTCPPTCPRRSSGRRAGAIGAYPDAADIQCRLWLLPMLWRRHLRAHHNKRTVRRHRVAARRGSFAWDDGWVSVGATIGG